METVLPKYGQVPTPLRSEKPGTWAHDTMSRRIIEEVFDAVVIADNPDLISPALKELREEIKCAAPLKQLSEDGGPDVAAWNELLSQYQGETWLSAPWLVAEFYFYRRIAAATDWFGQNRDFFARAKSTGLVSSLQSLEQVFSRVDVRNDPTISFLFIALWGNRMDLSLWPADSNIAARGEFDQVLQQGQAQLLCDHSQQVLTCIDKIKIKPKATIDLVVDNAGFELCSDLLLADHFLSAEIADTVRLRLKHHPTFVSDALDTDVRHHISVLSKANHRALKETGKRWSEYLDSGQLILSPRSESYWTLPYPFWEMPSHLRSQLGNTCDLIIIKGDANYRRALGDSPWPLDAPFSQVVSYFPCPVLCLRTLKAELGCGMSPDLTSKAAASDPNWLTNGKWGVLQFSSPSS